MALRCCEMARRCASPAEQVKVDEAVAHWKEWQAYLHRPQPEGPELTFRSLADLIELIGFAERLRPLSEEIAWEIYEAESYRRPPRLLEHLLNYPGLSGRELLAAGVTPRVMKWLGLGQIIEAPAGYPTLFQIRCGEWTLWGTVASGYMLLREEPLVLYKMSMP